MFDVEAILTESPPFLVTLEISRRETELDIVPHWFGGDNFCSFYIFQGGKEIGTISCTGINEWDWFSEPDLKWLAQIIGNGMDWHYL